jgi:hypothetical protein
MLLRIFPFPLFFAAPHPRKRKAFSLFLSILLILVPSFMLRKDGAEGFPPLLPG